MIPTAEQILAAANGDREFEDAIERAVRIQNAGEDAGLTESSIAALITADQLRIELQGIREDLQDLRQAVRS